MTADGAEEIYALRRAIEPMLLKRSVQSLTIVDLAQAEMALEDGEASIGEANWRSPHSNPTSRMLRLRSSPTSNSAATHDVWVVGCKR